VSSSQEEYYMGSTRSSSPKQMTRHHKVPRFRCIKGMPQPDNVVLLERRFHEAWHTLFADRTPFEIAILLIKKRFNHGVVRSATLHAAWQGGEETFTYRYRRDHPPFEPWTFKAPQMRAWHMLFADRSDYSVLHEVVRASRWSPAGYFPMGHIVLAGGGKITYGF